MPDNRRSFPICSFKQNLYIIGGFDNDCQETLSSCLVYNIKSNQWSQTKDMNDYRYDAACAVFEGKIIVSGGENLKSVEAYDYYENKWTHLPGRFQHVLVSMSNKMFVIGEYEKYTCSDFTNVMNDFQAVNIGNCIIIFSKVLDKR